MIEQMTSGDNPEMAVITERLNALAALDPRHDLLKWREADLTKWDEFIRCFWDRPSPQEGKPAAVILHNCLSCYSRELKKAIDLAKTHAA